MRRHCTKIVVLNKQSSLVLCTGGRSTEKDAGARENGAKKGKGKKAAKEKGAKKEEENNSRDWSNLRSDSRQQTLSGHDHEESRPTRGPPSYSAPPPPPANPPPSNTNEPAKVPATALIMNLRNVLRKGPVTLKDLRHEVKV